MKRHNPEVTSLINKLCVVREAHIKVCTAIVAVGKTHPAEDDDLPIAVMIELVARKADLDFELRWLQDKIAWYHTEKEPTAN